MNLSILHGHCVALGALAALRICKNRGFVSAEQVECYRKTMEFFKMPMNVSGLEKHEVIAATKNDKKMEAGVIKFILLDEIGHAYIDKTVSEEEMEQALSAIMV